MSILFTVCFVRFIFSVQSNKQYFLQRNAGALTVLLGKLFVFAYTWSFGGNFRRQDEMDDDGGIGRKGRDKKELIEIDIATEFDNFVHELFETEPPMGELAKYGYTFVHELFETEPPMGKLAKYGYTFVHELFETEPPMGELVKYG